MPQRILTVLVLVLVVLCCGLTVFAWQTHVRSLSLQQDLMARLAELADRREHVSTSIGPPTPAEWNRLTVQCVYDQPDGESVEGIKVSLRGTSDNTKSIPFMEEMTDSEGRVDFGLVLYGNYELRAATEDQRGYHEVISVRPGQDKAMEIVCPRPGKLAEVGFRISPDLDIDGSLWVNGFLRLRAGSHRKVWRAFGQEAIPFVMRPDGLVCTDPDVFDKSRVENLEDSREAHPDDVRLTSGVARFARFRRRFPEDLSWSETVQLPPGDYAIEVSEAGLTDSSDPTGQSMLSHFALPGYGIETNLEAASPYYRGEDDLWPVHLGRPAEIEIPPPDNWKLLEIATRLPEGMELQSVYVALPHDSEVLKFWEQVWDHDSAIRSFDLLTRVHVEDGDEAAESDAELALELADVCRHVQSGGLVVESSPRSRPQHMAKLWLFLRPGERRVVQTLTEVLVRPSRDKIVIDRSRLAETYRYIVDLETPLSDRPILADPLATLTEAAE